MKKYLLIAIVALTMLGVFIYGAKLFSPGSYANAERYELFVNEIYLDSLIERFKNENPQYKVPVEVGLKDGRDNVPDQDYWFHTYFYFPKENKIIYAWTRPSGKQKTIFAFVSVNDGLILGHWKDINKDFGFFENREQKKIFEERILNKIKEKIKE